MDEPSKPQLQAQRMNLSSWSISLFLVESE